MRKGIVFLDIIVSIALIGLLVATVQPAMVLATKSLNIIERRGLAVDHGQRITEILRSSNEVNDEFFGLVLDSQEGVQYSDERLESTNFVCIVEKVCMDDIILEFKVTLKSSDHEVIYAQFISSRLYEK